MITKLSFGKFIGTPGKNLHFGGFSFSEILDITEGEVQKHTHEDAHFLFVVQGEYITSARNIDASCSPSTLIYNPVGTTHRDRFKTRGGQFFTASISEKNLNRLADNVDLLNYSVGLFGDETAWLGAKLYREFINKDELSPLVMEGITFEMLGLTARRQIQAENFIPTWLHTAVEILNDCYAESLTVAEIAQTAGVHPFHLTRTFRQKFHCTPAEYLRKRRIEIACTLLQNPANSLVEIALASGFCDQSQFTKTFKRLTGFTPGQYRTMFFQ